METAINAIAEQGILGAIIAVLLTAVGGMFIILMKYVTRTQEEAREDRGELIRVLTDTAKANSELAKSVEATNALIMNLLNKGPL